MAGITRKTQKVFGGTLTASGNIAVVGSSRTGTPSYSTDLNTLQSLPAFGGGFAAQVRESTKSPFLQEMNALMLIYSQQLAYLLTRGLPEYDAGTTYNANDICRVGATPYCSLIDDNTGHAPETSSAQWRVWDQTPVGTVLDFAGPSTPAGYLPCNGAVYPVATYPRLGATLGSTYGGDGVSTFAVPDRRGRVAVGTGTGDSTGATAWTLGRKAGQETVVLNSDQIPAHSHSFTSPPTTRDVTGPGGSGSDPRAPAGPTPTITGTTGSTGGGLPHANLQPSIGTNFIIKY